MCTLFRDIYAGSRILWRSPLIRPKFVTCNVIQPNPLKALYDVDAYYPGHIVNGSLHTTLNIERNDNLGSQTLVDCSKL
jgi:hypothetical protein